MPASHLLEASADGSIALFIGGDLQFDSKDEHIYHEALVLPALSLALAAASSPLRALVCGGGDGLALRELLKSPRVASVELVDYDAAMVALARGPIRRLNDGSMDNARVAVHVGDARQFAAERLAAGQTYHVIICDLTWPQTPDDAYFHTTGWYETLGGLLEPTGVLALNACSPGATPEAFWAMVNGLRHAGLHPRPYRFALPSFRLQGYGDDWGMVVAAPRPLEADCFSDRLTLAGPRRALREPAQLRKLFQFPAAHAGLAASVAPAGGAADTPDCASGASYLLELLRRPGPPPGTDHSWNVLNAALAAHRGPAPAGEKLLPPAIRDALAAAPGGEDGQEGLLQRVLTLMPSLQREPAREMIASFLEAPGRFLASLDLAGLVERLLARAAELPALFVSELGLLRDALADATPSAQTIARVGARVLAVVAVVVIVGNLAHPDSVYGKGAAPGGFHTGSFLHAGHGGTSSFAPPNIAHVGGFRNRMIGRGQAVDEMGYVFPAPRYHIYRSRTVIRQNGQAASDGASEGFGDDLDVVYRLTPEVGLLSDGRLVMDLDDKAFFLLSRGPLELFDRKTGKSVLTLASQPPLNWRIVHELGRQRQGLEMSLAQKQHYIDWLGWLSFWPGAADDELEADNLKAMIGRLSGAIDKLPAAQAEMPPAASAPRRGAAEVFNGVWILPGSHAIAAEVAKDQWAYLDPARGWFVDERRSQPAAIAYAPELKDLLARYLQKVVSERDATWGAINRDMAEANHDLATLNSDLATYNELGASYGWGSDVDYGSQSMTAAAALELTHKNLEIAQNEVQDAKAQQQEFQESSSLYAQALASFVKAGSNR